MRTNLLSVAKNFGKSFFSKLIYLFLILITVPIFIIVTVSNMNAVNVVKRNAEISLERVTEQAYNAFLSIVNGIDEISLQLISSDLVREYCTSSETSVADIELRKSKVSEYLSGLKYGNKFINKISLFSLTEDSYGLDIGMDDSVNSFGLLSGEERKKFIEGEFISSIIADNGKASFHVLSRNPNYNDIGRLYFTRLLKDIRTGRNLMIISIYFSDYAVTEFLRGLDLKEQYGFAVLTVNDRNVFISDGSKYRVESGVFSDKRFGDFNLERNTFVLESTGISGFIETEEEMLVSYFQNEKHKLRIMSFLPVSSLTKSLDETLPFSIMITVIIVAVAIISGVLFSIYLKKRIDTINKQLSKIEEGFFNVEFETIKDDEIGLIENGIISMCRKLYTNTEELEAGYEELFVMNQELISMNEQIEASNKTKDNFLMNISHELRTPMNAIIGMTKLVIQTPVTQEQREYLKMIETSSSRLMEIIKELLDLTQIENGEMILVNKVFSLKNLCGDIKRVFNLGIDKNSIKFRCSISDSIPDRLVGDAGKIKQIISGLMGNAVKFTKKGEIGFDIFDEGSDGKSESFKIVVSDTGIGIDESKKDMIFDKFTQADSSLTRQYGGTGSGLYLVKKLVELMNGKIEFESEVGRGSTFMVTLKLEIAE